MYDVTIKAWKDGNRCPNCQRENEPTNRFCIFCGSPLPTPEAEDPSEPEPGPADALPKQLQALEAEVRGLREVIVLMNERLASLGRTQGIAMPARKPIPAGAVVTPGPEAAAGPAGEVSPVAQAPHSPPRVVEPAKVKEREWEQMLGG